MTSLTSARGVSLGQMTRNGLETVFLTPIFVQVVYFTFMHTVEFYMAQVFLSKKIALSLSVHGAGPLISY